MIYFKSFKKNKKNGIKKNLFFIILTFIIFFEIIIIISNRLESENINVDEIENTIEHTSRYIVGISKENIVTTGQSSSWGSGVIVSKNGYILTNAHVCGEKYSNCFVVYDYNKYSKGLVVWSDVDIDLAIVKVENNYNECISFGDSENVRIGQEIYTIGNPINLSFQKSVGRGIISGLNRSLEFEEKGQKFYMTNLIQTDAVINYGNSGGALIDKNGNLVGINTIKISDAELMGFAIPINMVKPIIESFENTDNFEEACLQLWCYDKYNINEARIGRNLDSGIFVAQVNANSNAEKAGVKVGDIITNVDTESVETLCELRECIFSKNVGDNVILKIKRANNEIYINLKLEKKL